MDTWILSPSWIFGSLVRTQKSFTKKFFAKDFIFDKKISRKWSGKWGQVYLTLLPKIKSFLESNPGLSIHPDKIFIKTLFSGVDFLGWVNFPDHQLLRKTTKRRMFKRIKENLNNKTLNSYLGLIKHGNTFKLIKKIFKNNLL